MNEESFNARNPCLKIDPIKERQQKYEKAKLEKKVSW
jgi:hypothetical protein